ncbi:MAG: 3-phosphoshikimate 1-carboxyvinyltransferase [Clostridia bacterium]|nr:3-phosphoshikimate 1-carboxyvinyltransferase [Clostridia bacterium]
MEQTITITPTKLSGRLTVPPSKSAAHRLLICAALAKDKSIVKNVALSQDISATISAMRALGSTISECDNGFVCSSNEYNIKNEPILIDCSESGSTLRFLIPIALAFGGSFRFTGRGRLLSRPLDAYYKICDEKGIKYKKNENEIFFSGKLTSGEYSLAGNVSSQYISGLLFALPLISGNSTIKITTPLESAGYIDMTLSALSDFGIKVENRNYQEFFVPGGQSYKAHDCTVEGDYSQAAFYLVANALGSDVALDGLNKSSVQGDKEIINIIKNMGKPLSAMDIDVSQIPDLVPVLAVLATQANGTTRIYNAARLRIKESDRLATTTKELKKLGADITELSDELIIRGKTELSGGVCDAHNDHRIAMALAVAATVAKGEVIINGSDCVKKSYGNFWHDYSALGGKIYG